jgi:glutamate racemase
VTLGDINADQTAPVGVFDSGVGGLTVLKALRKRLPGEDFLYLGDTARVPYGRKPPEMVRDFALQISRFLSEKGVKAVVVACNTASSVAMPALEELPVPVWGVLEPGVAAARAAARGGTVGVVGTRGTIASGAYQQRLEAAGLKVWARACPLFVPIVEEGLSRSEEAAVVARHYLADRPDLDALILGCTHYPLLAGVISEELGPGVRMVDSAEVTADTVAAGLAERGLLNGREAGGSVTHFVTGDPASYEHTSEVIGGVSGEVRFLPVDELNRMTARAGH